MPASKREELIDAAAKVFYERGFQGTSIDDVLEEAGISRMTLYNHFKGKDDLIVAALRRRDEHFRGEMMKFIDSRGSEPFERIMSVFDFHRQWSRAKHFRGCMFQNVAAEFEDVDCPIRHVAAEHKQSLVDFLKSLCEKIPAHNATELAEQLNLLLEGVIAVSQTVERVPGSRGAAGEAAQRAKVAAGRLIEADMSLAINKRSK